MSNKWNKRRSFINMHVMTDEKTKKIYTLSVTSDSHGDASVFKKLLDEAIHNIEKSDNVKLSDKSGVGCDGAYDSREIFNECERQCITLVIPVRKDFTGKANGSTARKKAGFMQLGNMTVNKNIERKFNKLTEEQN